jgi:hypothetical protein
LGLNPLPFSNGKGRGRRSYLSKAQSRAAMDMEARHQLSIIGALRVAQTLKGVAKWKYSLSIVGVW